MSRENVEIVRDCLEAWQRGSPRCQEREPPSPPPRRLVGAAVGAEIFHRHEGVREAVEGFDSAWDRSESEFADLVDAGDHVVARFTHRLRGRASGVNVVARYSAVFTLRDGKIVRFRDFASRSAALEAAGLLE